MHLDDSLLLGGSFSSIAYVGVIEASSPGGVETTLEDHGGKRASLISKKGTPEEGSKIKKRETGDGGSFGWGGGLRKSNEGVQRFPDDRWKGSSKCKSPRKLDCKTDTSSRYASRF